MITRITNARLIRGGRIEHSDLYTDGKQILQIGGTLPADETVDARGQYVCPGFIDIHVHGGGGCEFIDGTPEAVLTASGIHAAHGTTTIFPTLSSYETDRTVRAVQAVRAASGAAVPHIPGVHLEGPYFSPRQSGAQDPTHIRTPDPAEYILLADVCDGFVRRWSFAPELPGTAALLDFLSSRGIVAAAGHTDAELSHIAAARDRGMKLITHLYSCTSTVTRHGGFRHLGVIESAWYFDDMDVEIIADGCHLPPELISVICKIKGADHTCLVTDAIRYGGLDNTDRLTDPNGNVPYIIEDGVAKLADRSAFAGSIATMDRLIRVCTRQAGIPLPEAVKMATEVPARIMHLPGKGKLEAGYDADLVFLDDELAVTRVMVAE